MERVVILGRGGAGKSTLATRLGRLTGLPVIELDSLFWGDSLVPTPGPEWAARQRDLVAAPRWIIDGDLGPYDVPGARLCAADTAIVLDFSLLRCLWQSARRSRERSDYWLWVLRWRRRSRPQVLSDIRTHAPRAELLVFRGPKEVQRFLATLPPRARVIDPYSLPHPSRLEQ